MTAAGERTRAEFAEYMLPIIRERRENPGDDLLSVLCSAEVDGVRMSDEDIKAFCSLLLAAAARPPTRPSPASSQTCSRTPTSSKPSAPTAR